MCGYERKMTTERTEQKPDRLTDAPTQKTNTLKKLLRIHRV